MAWTPPKDWTTATTRTAGVTWGQLLGLGGCLAGLAWCVGAGVLSLARLAEYVAIVIFGVWTVPKTWTAVVVTVADLNTHIRDNLNYIKTIIDQVDNGICQGRLTLTASTPVTSADVTAATTIRFSPYGGKYIALYSGSVWALFSFTELSIAVPATTSQMYDVFIYDNAGTRTMELLAWTNDTTRATALVLQDGVLCKTGALTRRYVGSMRTTTVSGQTEDSASKRFVWNYYNRGGVRKPLLKFVAAATTWTYAVATTWRQANATTTNQVEAIIGWAESTVDLRLTVQASSAGTNDAAVAFGLDSTTTVAGNQTITGNHVLNTTGFPLHAHYAAMPAVGYHKFVWLEYVTSTTAVTFNDVFPASASGDGDGIVGTVDC